MSEHPIENLMKTAMESIKQMIDVNTVVGDPVETPDGIVIIPVSRVACGFGAGGGEYACQPEQNKDKQNQAGEPPGFGGGSGGGVVVHPVGFLVVNKGQVRFLSVGNNAIYDRLLDVAPQFINQLQGLCSQKSPQPQREQHPAIT
ncbi:GerW family sporulation protein [Desulfurispora thermophila]|uniref:GerW family sporulation protein n=1 Tax=Desulfurispora thermophila TaxID=265470 RepID=UPI0003790A0F|nr:GerW family sporulation protein [Desulfurispora thermophila]